MNGQQIYRYKTKRSQKIKLNLNRVDQPVRLTDPEPLVGMVQNIPATDIEERVARALYKLQIPFAFQVTIPVMGSIPGRGKVIDFLVYTRIPLPLEVDGPRWHDTAGQKSEDALREILLNAEFRRFGWLPLSRLNWIYLETQEDADRAVRALWVGRLTVDHYERKNK